MKYLIGIVLGLLVAFAGMYITTLYTENPFFRGVIGGYLVAWTQGMVMSYYHFKSDNK